MLSMIFVILCGILLGLLVGILPGVGHTVLLITLFPMLMMLPPDLILIFYIVSIQASEFSGSVSALSFGLLGEITSQPALDERSTIIANNALDVALKYSALASIVGCVLVMVPFPALLEWFRQQPVMMRTETVSFFSLLVLASVILWKENKVLVNALLVATGILMSMIGFDNGGSIERHFLTFGQPFLYNGIPMIAVVTGFIAMHALYKFKEVRLSGSAVDYGNSRPNMSFPLMSSIRGSLIGSLAGMIPMVGAVLSSNLAHAIEKKIHKGTGLDHSLARLSAAEAANNSSFISVLIPLLVLGVAIIPSEMFLTIFLDVKNWTPESFDGWKLVGIGFYGWIVVSLVFSAVVSYFLCYTLVKPVSAFLRSHLTFLNSLTFLVMTGAVIYSGFEMDNTIFFVSCFAIFSLISRRFQTISFIPLIAGFLLGDKTIENVQILWSLYF